MDFKKMIDERFDFLEIIPTALCVIDLDNNTLIKYNELFRELLRLRKNELYSLKDIIRFIDSKDIHKKDEPNTFFVIAENSHKELVSLISNGMKYSIEGHNLLLCSCIDILKNILPEKISMGNIGDSIENIDIFKRVFDEFPIFACVLSFNKKNVLYANPTCKRFFGPEINRTHTIDYFSDLDDLEALNSKTLFNIEFETIIGSKWFQLSSSYINYNGEKGILLLGRDITKIKKLEDKLLLKATTDDLTKVFNRQTALDYINDFIHGISKERCVFTVAYIDIKNIKEITDKFGLNEGDNYIINIVNILKSAIRHTDILARMHGAEFVIIFPNCVHEVVDNIMTTIKNKIEFLNTQGKNYEFSISYGVLEVNKDSNIDALEIIKEASNRMRNS